MGTSQSSSGSPSNVPMVPPWVPDIDPWEGPGSAPDNGDEDVSSPGPTEPPQEPVPIAPPGRFRSTRIALGDFGSSGSRDRMRRGVGRYVGTGLGGARTAVRRFGGTASTAAALYRALGGAVEGQVQVDPEVFASDSATGVIGAVIESVCPSDGTQDAEASRDSINDALSELLAQFPEADLLELSEAQREFVVERFVALDVFRRFMLDVGKAVRDKAPSATVAVSRLRQVKEYIREEVRASFRALRETGQRLRGSQVSRLVARALQRTFEVFEEYAQ